MPAAPFELSYDPDRFVHIPLEFEGTPWRDAEEWAAWAAETATEGRDGAEALVGPIRDSALALALFPSDRVSFRFWHYPIDGEPTGWVDVFVQARDDDGTPPAELLPEVGFTAVPPVVEPVVAPHLRDPVRRLTLGIVLPDEAPDDVPADDVEPVLVPKAEWIGVTPHWICYARTTDHDVSQLSRRLADVDALVSGIDLDGIPAS